MKLPRSSNRRWLVWLFGTRIRIAIGDLNGGGRADLVATNIAGGTNDSGNVSVLIGDGTGAFATPVNLSVLVNSGSGTIASPSNFTVGAPANQVVLGDVNGDGKADLVVANGDTIVNGGVMVLLNSSH